MSGLTANYNNYSAVELEKALQSWVEPYPKPIILNHDLNSEPIGRVIAAKMDKEEDGSPYVRLQIAVTDPVAAQKVADQRYLTGSVGGRAGKAICSISGEDFAAETADGRPRAPKYKRGQVYKGKLAFIQMEDISFKEYSFVNQPADQRSSVRSSKDISNTDGITNPENWTARSTAFVLNMDEEDIVSLEENESIFKSLKRKESRPLYLHLKGAFLTALAFQESETDKADDKSLLSSENDNNKEIRSMDEDIKNEDVLAAVEGLSQDLSIIAAKAIEAPEDEIVDSIEPTEDQAPIADTQDVSVVDTLSVALVAAVVAGQVETAELITKAIDTLQAQQAPSAEEIPAEAEIQISDENAEKTEEQASEVVDSAEAVVSDGKVEAEEPEAELKSEIIAVEQSADDEKIQSLQQENAKLREALHRTLVERVVDTKISLGTEAVEDREELITDHLTRSAGSLTDSLRDLAKLPFTKKNLQKLNESIIKNDTVVEKENNVAMEDEEVIIKSESKDEIAENLFVDALMGRRKL